MWEGKGAESQVDKEDCSYAYRGLVWHLGKVPESSKAPNCGTLQLTRTVHCQPTGAILLEREPNDLFLERFSCVAFFQLQESGNAWQLVFRALGVQAQSTCFCTASV